MGKELAGTDCFGDNNLSGARAQKKANSLSPKEVFTKLPEATCVEDTEALLFWSVAKVVR